MVALFTFRFTTSPNFLHTYLGKAQRIFPSLSKQQPEGLSHEYFSSLSSLVRTVHNFHKKGTSSLSTICIVSTNQSFGSGVDSHSAIQFSEAFMFIRANANNPISTSSTHLLTYSSTQQCAYQLLELELAFPLSLNHLLGSKWPLHETNTAVSQALSGSKPT